MKTFWLLAALLWLSGATASAASEPAPPAPSQTPAFEVRGFPALPESVAAGYPSCAILQGGDIQCWNALTEKSTEFAKIDFFPGPWKFLDAGTRHSCGITVGGSLHCWGANTWGELGASKFDESQATLPFKSRDVSAGQNYTCAALDDGKVRCWGKNNRYQLGTAKQAKTGACSSLWCRPDPVKVPGLRDAVAITTGLAHACALSASGEVRCWGENTFGQLGSRLSGPCPTDRKFKISCSAEPVRVEGLPRPATAIAAGTHFTCALLKSGDTWCWGLNFLGQLGAETPTRCVEPVTGKRSTPCSPIPLKVNGLKGKTLSIAVGEAHACALTDAGQVHCWGGNAYGELGDGTLKERSSPGPVKNLPDQIRAVSVEKNSSCAMTTAGRVYCWPKPVPLGPDLPGPGAGAKP